MIQLSKSLRMFVLRVATPALVVVLFVGSLASLGHAGLGTASPANPLIMGANQHMPNYDLPMHSAPFHALSRNLKIQNTRFVGGSGASFWDWSTGKFIPNSEIQAIWPSPWFVTNGASNWVNALPPGTMSVDAMVAAAAQENIGTIQWSPNLTTRENDQAAMINYLHSKGYDYSYIEADNEAFFWGAEFAALGGGAEYGRRIATKLAPTVRSLNPNAKIGANMWSSEFFTGSLPGSWQATWNSGVWSTRNYQGNGPHFDALILHHYEMNSNSLSGQSVANRAKAFLAFPEATLMRAAARAESHYGDLPIWVTEYNVIAYTGSGGGDNGTWIRSTKNTGWNALYNVGFYLTAISHGDDFTVMNHHEVLGAHNGWGLGEINSGTSSATISPAGVTFSHIADLVSKADEMMEVIPDSNPSLGVSVVGNSSLKVFQAAGLRNDTTDELHLLVMNRDSSAHNFQLSNFGNYTQLNLLSYLAEDTDANGFKTVQLDTATPIYAQASAPFNPTKSSSALTPGQALNVSLPKYSFSILTLSGLVTTLAGDFDEDGDVDGNDFLAWQRNPSVGSLADWQGNYGMSPPLAASSAVPEPATAILILFGIVILPSRRRALAA